MPRFLSWPRALALLFLAALVWKLLCLQRLLHSPLYGGLESDSAAYWGWAQGIARDGWVGHNPFFLGPLYPYLLSLWRPVPASSLVGPLVCQCVLGAASTVLVAVCARVFCGERGALIAGALAAGYSMSTFMDLSILSESVLWFLEAGLLTLQLAPARSLPANAWAACCGTSIGLISLARPSGFLFLASQAVAAFQRLGRRNGARSMLIALACAAGVCVPVLGRHLALGHGWIVSTYSFGYNLYIGNGPAATGAYTDALDAASESAVDPSRIEGGIVGDGREFIFRTTGRRLGAQESSHYFAARAWDQMRLKPLLALRRFVWKSALALNHQELYQLNNIHVHERVEGPLGVPWLGGFGVVGVLGLIGLVVVWPRPEGRVLCANALALLLPLVLFFVTDRYRHHLALPMLIAAGPALSAAADGVRRRAVLVRVVPGGFVAALLVWMPLVGNDRAQVTFETHRMLGEAWIRHGRSADGELELERCLEPELLRQLPLERSTSAREAVASVLRTLAESLWNRGEYARSESALRLAVAYSPGDAALRRDHAVASALSGARAAALAECDTLGLAVPQMVGLLLGIAESSSRGKQVGRAEAALRAAIAIDSTSEAANVVLLRLLRAEGRDPEARVLVVQMRARGVPPEVIARETTGLMEHQERGGLPR